MPSDDLPPATIKLESSLGGQAKQVLEAPSDDPCDKADAGKKRAIFEALQAHDEELRALPGSLKPQPQPSASPGATPSPTPSPAPTPTPAPTQSPGPPPALPLSVGPAIFFREAAPAAEDEWTERDLPSWSELYDRMLALRDSPAGLEWFDLNEKARSVLSQDVSRLIHKRNMRIRRSQLRDLVELHERLEACLQSAVCRDSGPLDELPPRLAAILNESPIYAKLVERIKNAGSADDAARDLAALTAWVGRDRRSLTFVKQPFVRRSATREITVTLDAGDFGEKKARDALSRLFLETWKSPDRRLKLEWKGEAQEIDGPTPFRILLSWAMGSPSYVDYAKREMNLVHGARTWSVQHELGHTLGLPDSYFVTWNSESCRYRVESNPGDLMSAPGPGGRVLDSTWELLFQVYK